MRTAFAIVFCLVSIHAARAEQVQAVPQVVDADTVYAGSTKIRLSGIDAPEMNQICIDSSGKNWSCGIDAKEKLQAFAHDRPWLCDLTGTDVYKRHLGSCSVGGEMSPAGSCGTVGLSRFGAIPPPMLRMRTMPASRSAAFGAAPL